MEHILGEKIEYRICIAINVQAQGPPQPMHSVTTNSVLLQTRTFIIKFY